MKKKTLYRSFVALEKKKEMLPGVISLDSLESAPVEAGDDKQVWKLK